MKDYCFHGQCVYIVDLDEHYCRYGQGAVCPADLPEAGFEMNCVSPLTSLLLTLSWNTNPAKYLNVHKNLKRSSVSVIYLSCI